MKLPICLILLGLGAMAAADWPGGKEQFPSFRNLSGLPGGAFGVTRNGEIGLRGAMGLSTPVAHSLGKNRWAIGLANLSSTREPRFFDFNESGNTTTNGTLQFMGGFEGGRYGRLTVGGAILSGVGDSVLNLHWQVPLSHESFALGIGVQDAFSTGGSAGEGHPSDGESSASLYAVATSELAPDLYLSLGLGTRRFEGVFGGISYALTPRLGALVEYDTFGWNTHLSYDLGTWKNLSFAGHSARFVLGAGLVKGEFFFGSLNILF